MMRPLIWVSDVSPLDKALYALHDYAPLVVWGVLCAMIGLAMARRQRR